MTAQFSFTFAVRTKTITLDELYIYEARAYHFKIGTLFSHARKTPAIFTFLFFHRLVFIFLSRETRSKYKVCISTEAATERSRR